MGALVAVPLLIAAALGSALEAPGSSRAGTSWLSFTPHPAAPYLLAAGARRDALVSLDVRNLTDRKVRVKGLRVSYLDGTRIVGSQDAGAELFVQAGLDSDPTVAPGDRETWSGLCLVPPSATVERARFSFELVQHRGLRVVRSTQVLELPLQTGFARVSLTLPVRGSWRVSQGHMCDTQHRRGRVGGEFAWDLVAINDHGRSVSPLHPDSHRNADTETFGRQILAPVPGVVVDAVDGIADNDGMTEFPRRSIVDDARDPKWIFGNHVVIDAGGGAFVLLAHLKQGSLSVSKGAHVRVGDPIAEAGNSGNTVDPHLHIQVMDRPDAADPEVSGLPAAFADYLEIAAVGNGKGEVVRRRVASGDPPQGAVLLAPGPTPPAR